MGRPEGQGTGIQTLASQGLYQGVTKDLAPSWVLLGHPEENHLLIHSTIIS